MLLLTRNINRSNIMFAMDFHTPATNFQSSARNIGTSAAN